MKKKRAVVLAVLAPLLLLAIAYLWRPSSVPSGQQPLITLSSPNFDEFKKAFGADADAPRLLLLLSPT